MTHLNYIKQIGFVALGGAAGSVLRFLSALLVGKYFSGLFPLGTFIVNIAGCFIVGLLAGIFSISGAQNDGLRLLLITGFCGGYTTFSAFALENTRLLQQGNIGISLAYILLSIFAGLLAVWVGFVIIK